MNYSAFLSSKTQIGGNSGFAPLWIPESAFDFQKALIEWALLKGKAAILAGTGLGKTLMQLVWAENVVRKTNRPVLILTPLCVSFQTVREAAKFGIQATRVNDGKVVPGINVTNYERLEKFTSSDFAGLQPRGNRVYPVHGRRVGGLRRGDSWAARYRRGVETDVFQAGRAQP